MDDANPWVAERGNADSNFRSRDYWNNTEIHKQASTKAGEWYQIEKNLDEIGQRQRRPSQRNVNIFRWSSKESNKGQQSMERLRKKKQQEEKIQRKVNPKLLNAAFVEARKIIDERHQKEELERARLAKEREERERRLKEQKRQKDLEVKRYEVKLEGSEKSKKKKGFLQTLFGRKSKISKDHLSNDAVKEDPKVPEHDDFLAFSKKLSTKSENTDYDSDSNSESESKSGYEDGAERGYDELGEVGNSSFDQDPQCTQDLKSPSLPESSSGDTISNHVIISEASDYFSPKTTSTDSSSSSSSSEFGEFNQHLTT
ncbi:hypothetical protein FOA43_002488 [Brettanomyces nanus]|uniref:Uncharacterized protein n=1 Tax=Eeniella nana TaxID=13502 RepID=A0A875S7K5_EENNA|nr:uncharacterized protein FOA43_002488 [Brettanomyces nanus]QPG75144.1 hypothetical protein FOA43_002488 [Brettanomyces nanus]